MVGQNPASIIMINVGTCWGQAFKGTHSFMLLGKQKLRAKRFAVDEIRNIFHKILRHKNTRITQKLLGRS